MAEAVPGWLQSIAIILALGLTIYLVLRQAREVEELQRRLHRKVKRVTVVECGGSRLERGFQEGDYVGKAVECSGGSTGRIIGIYAFDPEEERAREREKKLLER